MHRRRIVQRVRPVQHPVQPTPSLPQHSTQPSVPQVAAQGAVQGANVSLLDKYNPDVNDELVHSSASMRAAKVKEYHRSATNVPYKPITEIDLNKRYCEAKDLALKQDQALDERTSKELLEAALKEREVLNAKVNRYYSAEKKEQHVKQFEFTQKQIYRRTEEVQGTDALVKDRKEFYSKASEASQARKHQFNSLLEDLTRMGVSLPSGQTKNISSST